MDAEPKEEEEASKRKQRMLKLAGGTSKQNKFLDKFARLRSKCASTLDRSANKLKVNRTLEPTMDNQG